MTLDLAKIKSDAEKVAANSNLLLMALPVKDVLGMLAEIDRLMFEPAKHSRRLIEQLKAENEAMRKDAERYRWLTYENLSCVALDSVFDHYGVPVSALIDAEIAKEHP